MATLHITVPDADTITRQRAVNALNDTGIRVNTSTLREREPIGPSVVLGTGVALIFGALAVYLVLLGGAWVGAAALSALASLLGLVGLTHSLTARSS
ncbi:hypothetical protein NE857_09240 [Nocardiopsis exhalans]|uniref:Uncharacterized protein n=1 Tax=Nocardiopsis exhalans TaxID=163604 RepID=A0ABY5DCT3_9ACTN|nr:hypothetical protein [Nocardiopsis exhalans]USY21765.1 hypothetical protein NE857_09240 [Nocardiopsis exhalans]